MRPTDSAKSPGSRVAVALWVQKCIRRPQLIAGPNTCLYEKYSHSNACGQRGTCRCIDKTGHEFISNTVDRRARQLICDPNGAQQELGTCRE